MNNFINFKLNTNESGVRRTFLINVGHVVSLNLLPLSGEYAAIDRKTGNQKAVRAARLILTMNQSTILDELADEEVSDEIYRKLDILISADDGNLLVGCLLKHNNMLEDETFRELPVLNELNQE